jgi:hypothetical protein
VIRQAISCDICASEKRQTNHWFVAYEQAGELRLSNWNSRHRRSPDAKHLCGQTCLHKLVDEFMAKSIAVRTQPTAEADQINAEPKLAADTSLTSAAAHADSESSARLLTPPAPMLPMPGYRPQPELVTMPPRPHPEDSAPVPEEPPRYASRNWRAEAWERERERELQAIENRPDIAARRRNA